mmetsp:Transcript_18302/g.61502  ORF Transcript_18302/g.61502 Transcript_18302/m.61502 type:complete len:212 (-) Transcript_18302:809-1444(-)
MRLVLSHVCGVTGQPGQEASLSHAWDRSAAARHSSASTRLLGWRGSPQGTPGCWPLHCTASMPSAPASNIEHTPVPPPLPSPRQALARSSAFRLQPPSGRRPASGPAARPHCAPTALAASSRGLDSWRRAGRGRGSQEPPPRRRPRGWCRGLAGRCLGGRAEGRRSCRGCVRRRRHEWTRRVRRRARIPRGRQAPNWRSDPRRWPWRRGQS